MKFKTTREEFINGVKVLSKIDLNSGKGIFRELDRAALYTDGGDLFFCPKFFKNHFEYKVNADIQEPGKISLDFSILKNIAAVLGTSEAEPIFQQNKPGEAELLLLENNFKYKFEVEDKIVCLTDGEKIKENQNYILADIETMLHAKEKLNCLFGCWTYVFLEFSADSATICAATNHRFGVYNFEVEQSLRKRFQFCIKSSELKFINEIIKHESGDIYLYPDFDDLGDGTGMIGSDDSFNQHLFPGPAGYIKNLTVKTDRISYQTSLEKDRLFWNSVIPEQFKIKCKINCFEFLALLKSLHAHAGDEKTLVWMEIEKSKLKMVVIEDKKVIGRSSITCSTTGPNKTIVMNSRYLMEALESLESKNICIEFSDGISLIKISELETDFYSFYIMPYQKKGLENIIKTDAGTKKTFELYMQKDCLQASLLGFENYYCPSKMPWMFIAYKRGECFFRLPGMEKIVPARGKWRGTARVPTSILKDLKNYCESEDGEYVGLSYANGLIKFGQFKIEAEMFREDIDPGVGLGVPFGEVFDLYAKEGIEEVKKRGLYRYAKHIEEKFKEVSACWYEMTELDLPPHYFVKILNDCHKPENLKKFVEEGPDFERIKIKHLDRLF